MNLALFLILPLVFVSFDSKAQFDKVIGAPTPAASCAPSAGAPTAPPPLPAPVVGRRFSASAASCAAAQEALPPLPPAVFRGPPTEAAPCRPPWATSHGLKDPDLCDQESMEVSSPAESKALPHNGAIVCGRCEAIVCQKCGKPLNKHAHQIAVDLDAPAPGKEEELRKEVPALAAPTQKRMPAHNDCYDDCGCDRCCNPYSFCACGFCIVATAIGTIYVCVEFVCPC